jgi:GNAT superfamily N-acetyltransferase
MLSTRAATIADVPLLRRLIQELAEYERESQAVLIPEDELRRDGFGPDRKFRAIIAEQDGQPAGFAVFFNSYSTWTGSGLFLEDLFVRESFHGHGVPMHPPIAENQAEVILPAVFAPLESSPFFGVFVQTWTKYLNGL